MKLFRFANRPNANANQIPQVRVQTVHLIGPGTLRQRSEHLLFESEKSKQIRVDIEGLHDVLAYGDVRPTSDALLLMQNHGIGFSMLSPNGSNLLAHLTFETSQRALQRLIQFQSFNDARWQLLYAREVVCGKLQSTCNALRHYQRQGKTLERGILQKMERAVESASQADSVEQLRGIEGQGAALWYQQYGALLRPRWKFVTRNRRPPRDPVNALLSLGYMQLYRRCVARLEASGYEPSLGALHEFRPGRMSLACDLMEPLRVSAVDRWVYAMCQQGIVRDNDFASTAETGVRLESDQLAKVLQRFEEAWHQGNFRALLDQALANLRASLRERCSEGNSRTAKLLKQKYLNAGRYTENEAEDW